MYYPTQEEHLNMLEELQRLHYYVKNKKTDSTIDRIRDMVERIGLNYGYISAQPTRDVLELLEDGRYNDERIEVLLGVQLSVLENYHFKMSEYQDNFSILNDGWH